MASDRARRTGPPAARRPPIADLVAGNLWRDRGLRRPMVKRGATGDGERSDRAFKQRAHQQSSPSSQPLIWPATPGDAPERHGIVAPYGISAPRKAKLRWAEQEQSYPRLVDAIGMPELRHDPRFRHE